MMLIKRTFRVTTGTPEANCLIPMFCMGSKLIGLVFLDRISRIASWKYGRSVWITLFAQRSSAYYY